MAGTLLVTHQHVAQLLRVHQRVVGGQDGAAGKAEDDLGPGMLEGLDQRLGAGEVLRCHRYSFVDTVDGFHAAEQVVQVMKKPLSLRL